MSTTLTKARYQRLISYKSDQLKHLALHLGLSAGTNKASTATRLTDGIYQSTLLVPQSRILSIDMGIRNLAFCVLQPKQEGLNRVSAKEIGNKRRPGPLYKILKWQRLDITASSTPNSPSGDVDSDPTAEPSAGKDNMQTEPNAFTPSALAPVAVRLAHTFLSYQPTTILIERQRYRSGGAAAVQEWTLRVNTLEAMLWAAFEGMRQSETMFAKGGRGAFPDTVEMSPARIAAFWNARGQEVGLEGGDLMAVGGGKQRAEDEVAKRGMQKGEKIELVRGWLGKGWVEADEGVRDVVEHITRRGRGKRAGKEISGKLDDLADCLVQGVTFAVWECNRVRLRNMLDREDEVLG